MIDYEPTVKIRLPEQFKDKEKFNDFIQSFVDKDLEQAESDVLSLRWINTATGKQLDGIGEIVGLKRPRGEVTDDGDFGFELDDTAREFGDTQDEIDGGLLGSVEPVFLTPIDDDLYRILIKAKIFTNNSDMGVDSTLSILSSVFQTKVSYFLVSNLNPMYEIGREFTAFELNLLAEFTTTLGIGNTYYATFPAGEAFGFDGDDDALGFGDTLDVTNGGNLSNIIVV